MPKFEMKTTSQVERTYHIEAESEEQAHKRLRTFLADPEAVREGVVTRLAAERNVTPEQKSKSSDITVVPEEPVISEATVTELPAKDKPAASGKDEKAKAS